jgi:glucose-6-phosphate isomerase
MIKIDLSNLSDSIDLKLIESTAEKLKMHHENLLKGTGLGNDFLGWLTLPEEAIKQVKTIYETATKFRSQANITVVVGIGGSYLGAKALIESMSHDFKSRNNHTILYAGHHMSEDYMANLVEFLDNKQFNIIMISKSGTTTEPAIAFRILRQLLTKNLGGKSISDRIVAITDKSHGALRELAEKEGYKTFIIPDNVGGRYSVFTPVGLLPVAIAGFDIESLLAGASEMAALTRDNSDSRTNIAIKYATVRNLLYEGGKRIEMMVNYEPKLHFVAEWWKQLFGESEGKEGKGIFPASADLTTDLHSLGQYLQDGERILFETVLSVQNNSSDIKIPFSDDDSDGLNFISGLRISEVNSKAEEGTVEAHIEGGVPVIRIIIPELTERYLGQLLYLFQISCALSGYLLGVNPFDQPGVEAYKKNMFKLLGKKGY